MGTILAIILDIIVPALGPNENLPADTCTMVKIEAEQLPSLAVPRCGHATFCIGGEMVVVGGHTTGFVPATTAEYLSEGQWHSVPMTYTHDDGLSVVLRSGQILLAGGHKDNLGIGQSFEAQLYDPATHRFGHYNCMDRKRSLASGIEMDSNRVVVSGNWYAPDAISLFDTRKEEWTLAKPVSVSRAAPYIFRSAHAGAIVFGSQGCRGQMLGDSAAIVDCLYGEAFTVPLLRRWTPVPFTSPPFHPTDGFIGNEDAGEYAYLLLAREKMHEVAPSEQRGEPSSQLAILTVRDTAFSLLPTACPIPRQTRLGGLIYWYGPVIADRIRQRAYLPGIDEAKRLYLLRIDYAETPAPLTLYYTDPLPDCGFNIPVLTEEGDLAIVGGNFHEDFTSENYTPQASAYLIRMDGTRAEARSPKPWRWIWLTLPVVAVLGAAFLRRRQARTPHPDEGETVCPDNEDEKASSELMARICQLMEEEQLFRNSEVSVDDVAQALDCNPRYVADCIRTHRQQTFIQFINTYRVEYVKELLRQSPSRKIVEVYTKAGFASEMSFFRNFKNVTGMTTREWLQQQL